MRLKGTIIIILGWLLNWSLLAQSWTPAQLDSLDKISEQCNEESLKVIGYLSAHYYSLGDKRTQRKYVHKEIRCAEKLDNKEKILLAYYHLMINHLYSPDSDSLLHVTDKMLALTESDTSVYAMRKRMQTHFIIGNYYADNMDDKVKGFPYYIEAQSEALENGFYFMYLFITRELSSYYLDQKEFQKAIEIATESLINTPDFTDSTNFHLFRHTYISNMESIHNEVSLVKSKGLLRLNPSDTALCQNVFDLFMKQLGIEEKYSRKYNSALVISNMISNIGHCFSLDSLLKYGAKAIEIDKTIDRTIPELYLNHGLILIDAKRYEEAQSTLLRAVDHSISTFGKQSVTAQAYEGLVRVNQKLNQGSKAEQYFEKYKLYQDSMYIQKSKNAVEAVETKYELSLQEEENTRITQKAEELAQRYRVILVLGALLLALFLLTVYFFIQKRKSAKKLIRLNDTKDKLFAILAHDLKSPIGSLLSLSDNVKYLVNKGDFDLLRRMVDQTDTKLRALTKTLDNIFLWAITEANLLDIQPENVMVRDEVQNLIHLYSEDIGSKNLVIDNKIPEDYELYCDPRILQTIIRNLFTNAIKFSFAKGSVVIEVKDYKLHKELSISDRGIGLEQLNEGEESHESQLIRKNSKGSGIGLKVCREMASKAGMTLELKSRPEGGTVGIIGVPVAA